MAKAPTPHDPHSRDPKGRDRPDDDDRLGELLDKAHALLSLDPLDPTGGRELFHKRAEVIALIDLLAADEMAEEACELGLLLEQAMDHLGEPPGPAHSRFELVEHLLSIARLFGHAYYEGELLLRRAELFLASGDREQAESGYAAAQGLAQREGIGVIEVAALSGLAEVAYQEGNLFKAHSLYSRQQDLAERLGEQLLQSQALANLSATALAMGDFHRAARYARENLSLCRQMDDDQGAAESLSSLGMAQRHLGDKAESRKSYREALLLSRRNGNQQLEAAVCYNLGCLLADSEPALSASLLQHAQQVAARLGVKELIQSSARAATEIEQHLPKADLLAARRDAQKAIESLLTRP
jgi:tetratricopeptide (TPR) repeat protein